MTRAAAGLPRRALRAGIHTQVATSPCIALANMPMPGGLCIRPLHYLLGLLCPCPLTHRQAFGAENYPMLGLVLQRALLICWVACVPISVVWSQAHRLLSALGQAPEIVEGASRCE